MATRKLALKKEMLTALDTEDLRAVAGGALSGQSCPAAICNLPTFHSCMTNCSGCTPTPPA